MSDTTSKSRSTKLHLLDEHLIEIGHVAIRGHQLDSTIQNILIQLSKGLPSRMGIYLTNLPTPQQITLLGDVLISSYPEDKNKIDDLIKKIHGARTERNDIIHSAWSPSGDGESVNLHNSKNPRTYKREKVVAKDIRVVAERLLACSQELLTYHPLVRDKSPFFQKLAQQD
jgi:hypothetical protein